MYSWVLRCILANPIESLRLIYVSTLIQGSSSQAQKKWNGWLSIKSFLSKRKDLVVIKVVLIHLLGNWQYFEVNALQESYLVIDQCINFDNSPIQQRSTQAHLGLMLDRELSFKSTLYEK